MSDTTLNKYVGEGDDAVEGAFTPNPSTAVTAPENAVLFVNKENPAAPELKWWDGANFVTLGGSGSGTVTNTGTLTDHALIVGNGGVDVSALGSLGTTTTVLHGNAAGDPTFGAVVLTTDVSGDLPYANLAQGSALSVLGVTGNATADNASIAAANDHEVLRRSGTAVAFGAVNLGQAAAITGDLPFANLTQIAGLSVLGVTGSATADVAAITAATDGHVLTRVSSSSLAFAAPAFVKIEEQTPTGTAVTFSSLGSFTHLEIYVSARGDQAALSTNIVLTFNGDTGSNYDFQVLTGNGSTASATESLAQTSIAVGSAAAASATAGKVGVFTVKIYDYRGTTFNKELVSNENLTRGTGTGTLFSRQFAGTWRSTAAITSVTLTLASGNYVSGSKFSLYGLS